jgi:hypothetical protein
VSVREGRQRIEIRAKFRQFRTSLTALFVAKLLGLRAEPDAVPHSRVFRCGAVCGCVGVKCFGAGEESYMVPESGGVTVQSDFLVEAWKSKSFRAQNSHRPKLKSRRLRWRN